MYTPKYALNDDLNTIQKFIQENSFSILVSSLDEKIMATHLPLQFSSDQSCLFGHISKANPQWKCFDKGREVMAIFSGPHAYISSSWYDHENVPTWNYIAVHVYGSIQIIEGEALKKTLAELMDKHEQFSSNPMSIEKMTPAYVDKAIQGLVGFKLVISHIEASYKLSQNRDKTNHQRIIDELEKNDDSGSMEIAREMKKRA